MMVHHLTSQKKTKRPRTEVVECKRNKKKSAIQDFDISKISQETCTGFFCATDMGKLVGKRWANYALTKSARMFMKELAIKLGMLPEDLVVSNVGGNHSGTHIHPELAIDFARWLSPRFGVEMYSYVSRCIVGDLTLVADICSRSDEVNGTTTMATITTSGGPQMTVTKCLRKQIMATITSALKTRTRTSFIQRYFLGTSILQHVKTGYMNGSVTASIFGKLISDYKRNKGTKSIIAELALDLGLPEDVFIISGVPGSHNGSWVHPTLCVHLAMWISPKLAVQVMKWTSRYIAGDLTLVADICARSDEVNWTTTMATITTSDYAADNRIKKPKRQLQEFDTNLYVHNGVTYKIPCCSDGFMKATEMCKIFGRRFHDYFISKKTQTYLNVLAGRLGLEIKDIVITKRGGDIRYQGSWIHPLVAVHFAMWLSPEFAVDVMEWTARFIAGDLTLVADICARSDEVNGTTTMATTTTSDCAKGRLQEAHRAIASTQKGGVLISKETSPGVFTSEYVQSTLSIDRLWLQAELDAKNETTIVKQVYFIRIKDTDMVKIGFSQDVRARIKQLSTGNPFDLVLEGAHETKNYRKCEMLLHQHFIDRHVHGEWFRIEKGTKIPQQCLI
jgi:hypothetical protein